MKLIPCLAFVCLAALQSATSAAADDPHYGFECDTPPGHFSYWTRSVSGSEIKVSGKVTVNDVLKDKKWSPLASAVFRGGKDQPAQFGLRLYAVMKTPDLLFLELLKIGGRDPIGLGGMIPRTNQPIAFTLQLDGSGLLKVTVNGTEAATQLGDFKPTSFDLSCSTGDFEFTDIAVAEKP